MAVNTDTLKDKGQDALNGSRRTSAQAKGLMSDIDVDQITSQVSEQVKDVVRMGDEYRRERPMLFWGAIASVTALLAFVLFRPRKI